MMTYSSGSHNFRGEFYLQNILRKLYPLNHRRIFSMGYLIFTWINKFVGVGFEDCGITPKTQGVRKPGQIYTTNEVIPNLLFSPSDFLENNNITAISHNI